MVWRNHAEYGRPLSPKELRVLSLLAHGRGNKEIAKICYITEATVKTHIRRIGEKLGTVNRTHSVAMGYQLRLLIPGRPAVRPLKADRAKIAGG